MARGGAEVKRRRSGTRVRGLRADGPLLGSAHLTLEAGSERLRPAQPAFDVHADALELPVQEPGGPLRAAPEPDLRELRRLLPRPEPERQSTIGAARSAFSTLSCRCSTSITATGSGSTSRG